MEYLRSEQINKDTWKAFVDSSPFGNPFQSTEFYNFFNSIPGSSSNVFAVDVNEIISALCIVTIQKGKALKGFFSRRAIIYGGPIVNESAEGRVALDKLLDVLNRELKNKVIYCEVRNSRDYSFFEDSYVAHGWQYRPYLNIQINIKDKTLDDIKRAMKYTRRREINMSIKEGAFYKEAKSNEEVLELYKILEELYKERVKLPLPSFDFFLKLYNSEIGKVFIVIHNNTIIGGSFCIYSTVGSISTFYYCGLRDYNKKIFPTHLAIIAAIEFGINNNLNIVDLMGAGRSNEEYGVRDYKAQFGGQLVENGRYLKIFNPILYKLGTIGIEVWGKIKK
jgi:lipid II:glycine glycyltransferase (peptidoglycan interpeptide bridge formation enzyme)